MDRLKDKVCLVTGGAKGLGELPMDGPAPAIINAVCDALGVQINTIPLTPERLMTILDGATDKR